MTAVEIAAPRDSLRRRVSDVLVTRHGFYLFLLLVPPLLWLGVVYLGSLFALLAESFFSIDDFSGIVVRQPTLATYAQLFQPANFAVIVRTIVIASIVTVLAVIVAFPIAYYAARYARGRMKAAFYVAILMPLWSSYLVKVYAWKLLAKEGIIGWVFEQFHATWVLEAILALPTVAARRCRRATSAWCSSSSTSGSRTWCCRCRRRWSACRYR